MKRAFAVAVLAILANSTWAAPPAQDSKIPPPPPMPEKSAKDDTVQAEPQVTIIKKADEVISEYRLNGKLYMIKVTPRGGPTYYMVDETGNGQMVRREGEPALKPPMWVLFTF